MVIALKESQTKMIRAASGIVLAGQPVRVAARRRSARARRARPAPTLAEQPADAVEHLLALDRVRLHERPLLVVERAGLVDDRVRDRDLADVVQQRAELGLAADVLARRRAASATRSESSTTSCGVVAGVLVVLLEQVAQQQRGAAVGAAELDRLREPAPRARAAKTGSSETSGSTSSAAAGASAAANAASRPIGSEQRVDPEGLVELGEHRRAAQTGGQHGARGLAQRVGHELGARAPRRTRARRPSRAVCAPRATSTTAGTSANAGVVEGEQEALAARCAAHDRRARASDARRGDQQRHERRRQQQEHRHEEELRRDDVAVAERGTRHG